MLWVGAAALLGCGQADLELSSGGSPPELSGQSEQPIISEADEWSFFNKLNGERASRGLSALRMQTATRQIAREW